MLYVTGDVHLGSRGAASATALAGDTPNAWRRIIADCVRDRPSWLVIAGDLFDSKKPAPDACSEFLLGALALEQAGVGIAFIEGNHERSAADDPVDPQRRLPWALALHRRCLWLHSPDPAHPVAHDLEPGIKAVGIDCCPADELRDRLRRIPKKLGVNLLVLHQMCKPACPDLPGAWDFDPDWVPASIKCTVMGDLHRPWTARHRTEDGADFSLLYTGSTALQGLGEPPEKSYLRLEFVEGRFSAQRVALPSRAVAKLRIRRPEDVGGACIQAAEAGPGAIVEVTFDPTIPRVMEQIGAAAPGGILLPRPARRDELEAIVDPQGTDFSLEELLEEVAPRGSDPELHSLALACLNEQRDPEAVLRDAAKRVYRGESLCPNRESLRLIPVPIPDPDSDPEPPTPRGPTTPAATVTGLPLPGPLPSRPAPAG